MRILSALTALLAALAGLLGLLLVRLLLPALLPALLAALARLLGLLARPLGRVLIRVIHWERSWCPPRAKMRTHARRPWFRLRRYSDAGKRRKSDYCPDSEVRQNLPFTLERTSESEDNSKTMILVPL